MCFSPIIDLTIAAGISIWPASHALRVKKTTIRQFVARYPSIPFTTMARSSYCFTVALAAWFKAIFNNGCRYSSKFEYE
jgi:hypothetical protein